VNPKPNAKPSASEKAPDPNPGEKDLPPADPELTEAAHAAFEAQQTPAKAVAKCPSCGGKLVAHGPENPYKAGSWHCNDCGSCWAPGLREQREGHPAPVPST
jgi:hypothetical protein